MKKLITLTVALLMTTQVFAENESQESTFTNQSQRKCLTFKGKVNDNTSIKITDKNSGLPLDDVDINVYSYSEGKNGIWTPIGDQEWYINLFYRGIKLNVPFKVEIENVGTTSASQGPNLNFKNFKDCKN